MKSILAVCILFGYLNVAMAAETVDLVDDEALIENPSVQIALPGQEIDARIPQKTLTTFVNVLVGGNGEALRIQVAESSGKIWLDQRAVKLAFEKQYPVRTKNAQPVEYWLEDQVYEVTIRAMNNRVDGLPGDPDDDQGERTNPRN